VVRFGWTSDLKGEVPPLYSITPQTQNEHLDKGFKQEMTGLTSGTWDIPIIVAKDIYITYSLYA